MTAVKNRIFANGKGWVFTSKNFLNLGSDEAIRQSLFRLKEKGIIRQLSHGLYDYPDKHPQFGVLPPNITQVAKAIAEKYTLKIQPSGAYATNLLGLSEQIPCKITFLTDGPSKTIKFNNLEFFLKKTTPKNMSIAGSITSLLIQSFKYLGKNAVTEDVIFKLKSNLSPADFKILDKEKELAPNWIKKIINRLIEEQNK